MNDAAIIEAAWALNPRTIDRARRLAVALHLLREGRTRRDVCTLLRHRFPRICQSEAWRVVDMAADMAGTGGRP